MKDAPVITKTDIRQALERLGARRGDSLLLHSALSSMGHVDGGAEALIDAIMETLGPAGNLMAPTFTYSTTTYFDPVQSPSKTGAVTEALRLRPGAVRSFSPTHSVCVLGPDAERLVAGHLHVAPSGIDSPIDRLAREGGSVLLLGVDHRSSTTVHVGETYARAPYLAAPRIPSAPVQATVKLPTGEEVVVTHTEMNGCSAAFNAVELPLRRRNAIRDTRLGNAHCQLMRGQDVIDATVELLAQRMDILLCNDSACEVCVESRRRIADCCS
ncbi:MAG: AAC(3) family N-acetyltransferase [Armatimonadota bacterium]